MDRKMPIGVWLVKGKNHLDTYKVLMLVIAFSGLIVAIIR